MVVQDRRNPPPSPCNFTCVVDRRMNWCVGCLRTLEEIGRWEQMAPPEQWAVVDELPKRRAKLNPHGT
jgi:predicted Fe-S protein YdhL (DUF1289 family)